MPTIDAVTELRAAPPTRGTNPIRARVERIVELSEQMGMLRAQQTQRNSSQTFARLIVLADKVEQLMDDVARYYEELRARRNAMAVMIRLRDVSENRIVDVAPLYGYRMYNNGMTIMPAQVARYVHTALRSIHHSPSVALFDLPQEDDLLHAPDNLAAHTQDPREATEANTTEGDP